MKKTVLFLASLFTALSFQSALAHGEDSSEHNKLCPVFFPLANICAQVEFTRGPVSDDEAQFLVKFYDHASAHGEHVMVDPAGLKVDLWMNMGHHGHGSSPVKVVKQSTGIYFVSEAYFVMPGRWTIRVFSNNEQAEFPVDVK